MLKRKVMVVYGKKAEYHKQVDSFLKEKIPPLIIKRKERSRMSANGVGEGNSSGVMFRTLVYITRNKPTLMSNNSTGVNNNDNNNVLLGGNECCDSARSPTVKLNMVNAYKVKDKQCYSSRNSNINSNSNSSRYNYNVTNKYKQRTCSMGMRKKFFQAHNKSKTEIKQNDNNEEKVNTFINNEFKSVRLGIEEQVRDSVFTLNKEINLNFSLFKPQLLSPRCLPDKHRRLSKYVNLSNANKHQHHAIPLKLLNNTYNINTIRNNYSFIKKDTTTTTPRVNIHHPHKIHICSDYKRNRWRIASYFVIKHLNNLKIYSLSSIFNNPQLNLTPTFPFEHPNSQQCFLYVKSGNKPAFINIITRHRHLLLNFDASYQNIIHWIIKRNKYDYISFAGAKGACLNFRDFTGKTPLHYACTSGHIESVMVLLFEMANPFIVDNNNKTCEQYITSNDNAQYSLTKYKHIIKMIKRAKALHLLHMNGSLRSYCDRIRKGLYFLYVYQLRLEFNFEKYCMYDSVNGYYIHFDDEQWNKINEFIKLEEELYKKQQLLNIN